MQKVTTRRIDMHRVAHLLHVTILGVYAQQFAAKHPDARVIALFERSLHIAAGCDVICLVAPDLGHGPLNAVIDQWEGPAPGCSVEVGAPVRFNCRDQSGVRLLGGQLTVETGAAAVWHPPRPPDQIAPGFAVALATLEATVGSQAGLDGLARLALGLDSPDDAVARIAKPRLARFASWLDVRSGGAAPTDLIGLGPGLTPSGDDLLCGAMIGLRAAQRADKAAELSRQVAIAAPGLTTPLSCAFLTAAGDGQAAERLHLAVNAIVAGQTARIAALAADVGAIGHSSGWDALAGVVLALRHSFQHDA